MTSDTNNSTSTTAENTNLFHGLTIQQVSLLATKCAQAKDVAYCPYSKFQVGAALLCNDGDEDTVVIGANVENASYPVGVCAERVALSKAITDGKKKFAALAVSTNISPPGMASPCGMCRQFIREFCDLNMPVLMYDKQGEVVVMTVEQLLPLSFGPSQLPGY